MSISLIPESAPFTDEQRAWLNGFFAGLTGLQDGQSSGAGARSLSVAEEGSQAKIEMEPELEDDPPWHDPGLPLEERLELANDRPPAGKMMAAMAQLDCGACGYVCKTYAQAIAAGEETALNLCVPGGKETNRTLKALVKEFDSGGGATTANVAPSAESDGYSRSNPFPSTVLHTRNLNGEGSAKHVTHVELDLTGSDLTYDVGDSLGVYPTNCTDLVSAIVQRLGATGDEAVTTSSKVECTLNEALINHCCLADVTDELLDLLTKRHVNGMATAITTLQDDPDRLDSYDVLELLQEFGTVPLPVADFVHSLSALSPRLYSISSSLKANPNQVHLTVGRVSWMHNDRERKGVCSTLFADRVDASTNVRVFVQKSHGFGLPDDPACPVIMVGPGTGIAPFRAFLQERESKSANGPNWLFFGDQKQETDYLYSEEFAEWQKSGLLSRVDLAFSRDQEQKVYVQHRMIEAADELYQWLEQGACFYVCGDAKRMASDVDRALHQVVETASGCSTEDAKAYIQKMKAEGRYQRDVY